MKKGWSEFFNVLTANGFFWTAAGTVVAVAGFCLASVLVMYVPSFAEWTKTITFHDILVSVGFWYTLWACLVVTGTSIAVHHDVYDRDITWLVIAILCIVVMIALGAGRFLL